MEYFGGILHPIGKDANTDDLVYEYRPWNRNPEQEKLNERIFSEEEVCNKLVTVRTY
jgi:hypothetical protein